MDLKEYLLQNDITQIKFAKMINRSRATVNDYVNGWINVSLRTAVQIEKVTNGQVTRQEVRPDLFKEEK